jgi:hypothetical protein
MRFRRSDLQVGQPASLEKGLQALKLQRLKPKNMEL